MRESLVSRTKNPIKLAVTILLGWMCLFAPAGATQDWAERYVIGATVIKPKQGAPIFIGGVTHNGPADLAGIRAGDRVLTIAGVDAANLTAAEASKLVTSDKPGPVLLKLWRQGREYEVEVVREKFAAILTGTGRRVAAGGLFVPVDVTEAEIERISSFNPQRIAARVFPIHYPPDPEVFSAGFEVFLLRDPPEIAVGGLENGPASRAGLHWGDVILSINGESTREKTVAELEAMLTGERAQPIRLQIERVGSSKTIEFSLEKTSEILKQNQLRMINGQLVPAGVADEDLKWFLR